MTSPLAVEGISSLEQLRAVFAAGGFGRGIGDTLGLRGRSAASGEVVLEGRPTVAHHNPAGMVHGGYIATMLDAAMGLAVQTKLEIGSRYSTANLNITFLRAVRNDVDLVLSEAKVIHNGRDIFFAEAKVSDERGLVYAHGSATFRTSN